MPIGIESNDTCSAELELRYCASPQPKQHPAACCQSCKPIIAGTLLLLQVLLGFTDAVAIRHADSFQPDFTPIWPLEIPSSCSIWPLEIHSSCPIKEHVSLIFLHNPTGC
jgi:hypothetical protein